MDQPHPCALTSLQVEFVGREEEEEADFAREGKEYHSDQAVHVQPLRGGLPGKRLPSLAPSHQGKNYFKFV